MQRLTQRLHSSCVTTLGFSGTLISHSIGDAMSNYDQLFADALADVENQHACQTTDECFMQGGCPKCLSAVVRSQQALDVAQIDVFEGASIVRL